MRPEAHRPEFQELVDWLDGRLDVAAAARVAAWVDSGDPHTCRAVDWLRGFMATAHTLPLHAPPPLVRQNLNQYFRQWSRGRAAGPRPTRLFQARLMFDSRRDVALAGARAAIDSTASVHIGFSTDVADLVVDVGPWTEMSSGGSRWPTCRAACAGCAPATARSPSWPTST
jgi:hypothetical protein